MILKGSLCDAIMDKRRQVGEQTTRVWARPIDDPWCGFAIFAFGDSERFRSVYFCIADYVGSDRPLVINAF